MSQEQFVYVTYIRTTPEALWDALTEPEFTRSYWSGVWHDTTWEEGSSWKLMFPDGRVADAGEIVEVKRPHRLVLKWRNEFMPELKAEGFSTCVFELEAGQVGDRRVAGDLQLALAAQFAQHRKRKLKVP